MNHNNSNIIFEVYFRVVSGGSSPSNGGGSGLAEGGFFP